MNSKFDKKKAIQTTRKNQNKNKAKLYTSALNLVCLRFVTI